MTIAGGLVRSLPAAARATLGALAVAGAVAALAGCEDPNRPARRAVLANQSDRPVRIGIVWGNDYPGRFVEGAEFARDEINEAGGIAGRPIEFRYADATLGDADPFDVAYRAAHQIVSDESVFAVIGHNYSATAIPASIIYEEHGVLFLATASFQTILTRHGFNYVFRTAPTSEMVAKQLAIFAFESGYRDLVIMYTRQPWAEEIAGFFDKAAITLGLKVTKTRSFFAQRDSYRDLLADIGSSRFDAILLVGDAEVMARVISQSLEMQIETAFILGNTVDLNEIGDAVGDQTGQIAMPLLFNHYSQRPGVPEFSARFETRFGARPGGWAAQGYDAIRLLAAAAADAGSTAPLSVASVLRYTLSWRGITGRHSFDRIGDAYTKILDIEVLEAGEHSILEATQ